MWRIHPTLKILRGILMRLIAFTFLLPPVYTRNVSMMRAEASKLVDAKKGSHRSKRHAPSYEKPPTTNLEHSKQLEDVERLHKVGFILSEVLT